MKQCIPHVFRDADNFPLVSFCYERFADRVFSRPMAPRQCFVDDDDRLLVADFLFSERAAIQQWDAERGKVIWRNAVACDRLARGSNRHTRAAIHSRNGRAAIIRPIYGNVAIAFKWLVHQWRMADPYGVFNRRRGEEAFLQFALKLRGADLVIIARTGRSESEWHDRKILRFKARINRRHAKQSP